MSDKYTDDGGRGRDDREGFGDDMGTRIGRPDGASAGQPSTNEEPVADGLEGSIMEGDGQRNVQRGSESPGAAPDPAAGNDRRIDDL